MCIIPTVLSLTINAINFPLSWYIQRRLSILPEEWPHHNFKARQAEVCPRKLSSPAPPKPIEPLAWPPEEWNEQFKNVNKKFLDVLVEELIPQQEIFTLEEPTRLKMPPSTMQKRSRISLLHWKEAVDKEVKKLIHKDMIKRAAPGAVLFFISQTYWVLKNTEERGLD